MVLILLVVVLGSDNVDEPGSGMSDVVAVKMMLVVFVVVWHNW